MSDITPLERWGRAASNFNQASKEAENKRDAALRALAEALAWELGSDVELRLAWRFVSIQGVRFEPCSGSTRIRVTCGRSVRYLMTPRAALRKFQLTRVLLEEGP